MLSEGDEFGDELAEEEYLELQALRNRFYSRRKSIQNGEILFPYDKDYDFNNLKYRVVMFKEYEDGKVFPVANRYSACTGGRGISHVLGSDRPNWCMNCNKALI